jgi:hypothetical protein
LHNSKLQRRQNITTAVNPYSHYCKDEEQYDPPQPSPDANGDELINDDNDNYRLPHNLKSSSSLAKTHNNIINAKLSVSSAKSDCLMNESSESLEEYSQRLLFLRQAFTGFFRAKTTVEMQHLGRVICAILGVTIEEQAVI